MPEPFLTPDVVEMITALISVAIALIALLEMRRMRRETIDDNREMRQNLSSLGERVAMLEVKSEN